MKRMFAVVRRSVICLLAIMGGATLASSTDKVDPIEFVPLEVGNRWVYRHVYSNEMYFIWNEFWRMYGGPDEDIAYWEAYFKQFEVPGYPMGESYPPGSLISTNRATVVVEITHTERIGGAEYFVFSEAPYDWPPLPEFFWAGQKVRLSDRDILFFYRNGTHIPLYDFREFKSTYSFPLGAVSAFKYIPIGGGIEKLMNDRLTHPEYLWDAVMKPAYQDQVLEILFRFGELMEYSLTRWDSQFVKGYGIGHSGKSILAPANNVPFLNILNPVSATLSGEEVSFKEVVNEFVLPPPELPPIVGQRYEMLGHSYFDFSEEAETSPLKHNDIELEQLTGAEGLAVAPPYLKSRIGMADLGQVDFGRLVSSGPADLQPDSPDRDKYGWLWSRVPQEGHTYAFWTQEGGIALMHILEIKYWRLYGVQYILFDWVYYPASYTSPDATSVQSTSWGELKNSLPRTK